MPILQSGDSPCQYRGIAHALATVLREEGPRALYKGWLPSVIGVVSTKLSSSTNIFPNFKYLNLIRSS